MSDLETKLARPEQSTGRARATIDQLWAMWPGKLQVIKEGAKGPLEVERVGVDGKKQRWVAVVGTKHFELSDSQ